MKREHDYDILKGAPSYSNCDTSLNWVLRDGPHKYYKAWDAYKAIDRILKSLDFDFRSSDSLRFNRARKKTYAMKKLGIIWRGFLTLRKDWPYDAAEWQTWVSTGKNLKYREYKQFDQGILLHRMHNAAQSLQRVCRRIGPNID